MSSACSRASFGVLLVSLLSLLLMRTAGCRQPMLTEPGPAGTATLLPDPPLPALNREVSEQPVIRIDPAWGLGRSTGTFGSYYPIDTFSPDGKRVAFMVYKDQKQHVVLDGTPEEAYDAVYALTFSPDSRRFAYVAREGAFYFVVLDGAEGKRYLGSSRPSSPTEPDPSSVSVPAFSPDSRHLAYVAKVDDGYCAVVDGVEGKPYEWIGYDTRSGISGIVFSLDSSRVAFVAGNPYLPDTHQEFAVIDGVEGKPYDSVFGLVFSPDSKRVAYVASVGDRRSAVIDGVEKPHDGVLEVVFSPNSKRVGYRAGAPGDYYMVIDGVRGKSYERVYGPVFSPDSRRVAYVAERKGKWFAVVDGREGKLYDRVTGPLVFSPDSRRFGYVAIDGDKQFVVMDGAEGIRYENIRTFSFSPDSRRFAYIAYDLRAFFVVVDGVEGKGYNIVQEQLIFSPDSRRLAYVATDGQGNVVVVDGVEGKQYDHILTRLRLPDGNIQTSLVFDSPSSLHYLAESGDNVYLVQETIK